MSSDPDHEGPADGNHGPRRGFVLVLNRPPRGLIWGTSGRVTSLQGGWAGASPSSWIFAPFPTPFQVILELNKLTFFFFSNKAQRIALGT